MRGAIRDTHRPGAKIPDDGCDQQGENHRIPASAANLEDEFDRQQGDDAVGHGAGGNYHPQKIEEAGPYDRRYWRKTVGINDRCNRVCGVVETIYELET